MDFDLGLRLMPCEACGGDRGHDFGPVPTPYGPFYRWTVCDACNGTGEVEVEMLPITMADLEDYCGDWS